MKKRVFIILVLITGFSVAGFSQNAKSMIKAGQKFMDGLKYEAAVDQFTRAIDVDPDSPDGYVARASAYEGLLKFNEALADLEKALVFAPKDVNILYQLGKTCNYLNKYDEALVYLNRAASIDKRNKELYPEKVITLMELGRYDQALKASDTALLLRTDAKNLYYRGIVYARLNNDILAKKEFEKSISKDKNYDPPRIELVDLLLREGKVGEALGQCNTLIGKNDRNTAAYTARSKVYVASMDFPNAINDISKNILIEPNVPDHYLVRGKYYQQFNQHSNAINDFSKYISLKPDDPDVYFARARSYEEIMGFDKAAADYSKITELSEFNMEARKMLKDAKDRLFELNRETAPPEISIVSPQPVENVLEIRGDNNSVLISGRITDKSPIESLKINDELIPVTAKDGGYEFVANVDVAGKNSIMIAAADVYNNAKSLSNDLRRTEINKPKIVIVAPYAS
ncbi:MAG: tetratricopeptide repeat protein, partial [Bacteroidales bacterium]|nr:tetratricopeptide repeat protein [Bacteroidales bacterium]